MGLIKKKKMSNAEAILKNIVNYNAEGMERKKIVRCESVVNV